MRAKDKKIIEDAEREGIPIFVLIAKDAAAVQTLKDYKQHCKSLGSPANHLFGIHNVIEEFLTWEMKNRNKIKIPD